MGRTVPTYRLHLESILDRWTDYRRALREKDRELFDCMLEKARMHSSAASFCAHLDPVELAMLSMLLEMQREIEEIKKQTRESSEVIETP
jgi:hypothetical protein